MQMRGEKCNRHLTRSSAPIELRAENLHKHQRKNLKMSADNNPVQIDLDSCCQGALTQCIYVRGGISEEIKSMVAPLRSRGAELDFWNGMQRQHSVLCVSQVCQAKSISAQGILLLGPRVFCDNQLPCIKTPDPSNSYYIHRLKQESSYSIICAKEPHSPSILCINEWPREADWSKCLCCFVPMHKDGAAQIFIILKRQQHNCAHIAVGYPAAQLEFHCR